MNRKWLGNRIKDARERRHLTQEKLSEIVDKGLDDYVWEHCYHQGS